jgi:glycosyltransferase involved in cell wall biosynthesis
MSLDHCKVLFIGKRYYTHRDALRERYGRIYQLPASWAARGIATRLWLIDYHGTYRETLDDAACQLSVVSTPLRSAAWLRELVVQVMRIWRSPPELVIASGDCYIGLLAWALARLARARFVFDVYDRYDLFGAYRALPGFDPWRFLLGHADWLLFASRPLAAACDPSGERSVMVPNGIDPGRFRPLDRLACRAEFSLDAHATYVGYFGSLDAQRGIDDLIAAVTLLRQQGSPLRLLLAGAPRHGLDLGLPWIDYLGNLPPHRVPVAIACCDVLALPYRSSPYLDMASSCKIAEYLACARPIAATRTLNLMSNFPRQAAVLDTLLAEPGDAAGLAHSIQAQLRHPRLAPPATELDWRSIADAMASALGYPSPKADCGKTK